MDKSTSKRLNELGVTGHGYKTIRNVDIVKLVINREIKTETQATRFLLKLLDHNSFRHIRREFEVASLFGLMDYFDEDIADYLDSWAVGELDFSVIDKLVNIISKIGIGDISNLIKGSEKFSKGFYSLFDLLVKVFNKDKPDKESNNKLKANYEICDYVNDLVPHKNLFTEDGKFVGHIDHSSILNENDNVKIEINLFGQIKQVSNESLPF